MPQVSKIPLRENVYQRIFELLVKLLTDSFSKNEAEDLINALLTPTERIVLAKRLAIAILLSKNYTYRDIQKVVHVNKETIARVNMSLRYGGMGYKYFIKRIATEEKIQKFWEQIEDIITSPGTSGGKGSGVWRYLRQEIKAKRRKRATAI